MLLKIKKQVEETVEVKAPCYYKGMFGGYCYINESGQLIKVMSCTICIWDQADGIYYNSAVDDIIQNGTLVPKEEFEKHYAEVLSKLNTAAGMIEINS